MGRFLRTVRTQWINWSVLFYCSKTCNKTIIKVLRALVMTIEDFLVSVKTDKGEYENGILTILQGK